VRRSTVKTTVIRAFFGGGGKDEARRERRSCGAGAGVLDKLARLIEDVQNTSNEASVVYGKIGRACARALANDAATAAKLAKRTEHVLKFQSARQNRLSNKRGTPAQSQRPARPQARAQRA
jgi:hypothetical protein